jgi:hypothetical protein
MRLLWASLHGGPRVLRTHAESARQHDEILNALADGDAAAASTRTYHHIMGAVQVENEGRVPLAPLDGGCGPRTPVGGLIRRRPKDAA